MTEEGGLSTAEGPGSFQDMWGLLAKVQYAKK